MGRDTILVVDDEQLIRRTVTQRLGSDGYEVLEADTGRRALHLASSGVDLVILDYRLPDIDGVEVLRELKQLNPDVLVILLTAYADVDAAVRAMKLGAFHFANKPFDLEALSAMVEQALETTRLRREIRQLRATQAQPYRLSHIVGNSRPMAEFKTLLTQVAESPSSTVLLSGESGTGKDLAAKVLHYTSHRAARPFMNITCSALPEALLESELFGYERGAFTDARQLHRGLLESADGGTVFLDEIGEMPISLQAKLLRFLEEKAFRRVGGTADIHVDVRIVAATNRPLTTEVRQGRFREDLFYRLDVLPLALPALREHIEDLPALAQFFIEAFNQEFKKRVVGLSDTATALLLRYRWPGNVRELRNAIERAMLLAKTEMLEVEHFPQASSEATGTPSIALPSSGLNLESTERDFVLQALERSGWNQARAAKLLGLNRDQIHYRIEKFGLMAQK